MSRPLLFETPEEMQEAIDAYFESKKGGIVTVAGLALALGMDRRSLLNYEGREEFFPTIKRAKLRIEEYVEEMLYLGKNAAGPIFNLKNNFGWKDEKQVDSNVTLNGSVEWVVDATGNDTPEA